MTIDPALKDAFSEVGDELLSSGVLNDDERASVVKWTTAMGVAYAMGEAQKVRNYKAALEGMLGVAELRAAAASEKAALRLANLALEILVKVAIAAV